MCFPSLQLDMFGKPTAIDSLINQHKKCHFIGQLFIRGLYFPNADWSSWSELQSDTGVAEWSWLMTLQPNRCAENTCKKCRKLFWNSKYLMYIILCYANYLGNTNLYINIIKYFVLPHFFQNTKLSNFRWKTCVDSICRIFVVNTKNTSQLPVAPNPDFSFNVAFSSKIFHLGSITESCDNKYTVCPFTLKRSYFSSYWEYLSDIKLWYRNEHKSDKCKHFV